MKQSNDCSRNVESFQKLVLYLRLGTDPMKLEGLLYVAFRTCIVGI